MDIASIIGVITGSTLLLVAILLGGSLRLFWDLISVFIVVGGTIAAALIANPLTDFLGVFKTVMKVFIFKIEKPENLIKTLVEISNKARKGGLLSIEGDLKTTSDPYLRQALQMTVDGVKTSDIAAVMQKKMELTANSNKSGFSLLKSMGSYAPAFGMIGTLVGLVQMLANLDDPSSIGPKMAVAMITTFYGSIMANLFFIPMADKLKVRSEEEIMNMTLLYEGVVSIREGEHPRLMEDKLNVYLRGKGKAEEDKSGGK